MPACLRGVASVGLQLLHLALDGRLCDGRLEELVPVVLAVGVAILDNVRVAHLALEALLELDGAPHEVTHRQAALALHARGSNVLRKRAGDGPDAARRRDRLAVVRHAQAHVADRRHAVGEHGGVVGVEEHRLDDGHVAMRTHYGALALVVTRDVGEEEAGLLGHAGVGHVVAQLGDRERERVHVGEACTDLVCNRQAGECGKQLGQRAWRLCHRAAGSSGGSTPSSTACFACSSPLLTRERLSSASVVARRAPHAARSVGGSSTEALSTAHTCLSSLAELQNCWRSASCTSIAARAQCSAPRSTAGCSTCCGSERISVMTATPRGPSRSRFSAFISTTASASRITGSAEGLCITASAELMSASTAPW